MTMRNETLLEAESLNKYFTVGGQRVTVLQEISLAIAKGEFVVVTGTSGSGKSTLLSVLSGIDRPSSGKIRLGGIELSSLSEEQLAPIRNTRIGFVFQSFHLIPSLNAMENVMFPAELLGADDPRNSALALLDQVGLGHRSDNYPQQLSGGEQQRVAICRALINSPDLLFADEPTGNLDSRNSQGIIELLINMHQRFNTTLVVATHSSSLAEQADRKVHLHDGRIE
jgi:putative ABC transport system ATP-binding protein